MNKNCKMATQKGEKWCEQRTKERKQNISPKGALELERNLNKTPREP